MKQLFFTILFTALAGFAMGQPALDHVGDNKAGSRHIYLEATDPDNWFAGNAGANVVWDFSGMALSQDTFIQDIVAPTATQYADKFPTANLVERNSDSTLVYLKRSDSQTELVGYVGQDGSFVINYTDPWLYLKRPLKHTDSNFDITEYSYELNGMQMMGKSNNYTIADAYGTLKLPGVTYANVLRVRFIQMGTDSGAGQKMTNNTISTTWYDADHNIALLKIDSTHVQSPFFMQDIKEVKVLQHEHTTGIATVAMAPASVYMQGDKLIISGNMPEGSAYHITVMDMQGRQVHYRPNLRAGHKQIVSDGVALPAGTYILQCVPALGKGACLQPAKFSIQR